VSPSRRSSLARGRLTPSACCVRMIGLGADAQARLSRPFMPGANIRVAASMAYLNVADQMRQTDLMAAVGPTQSGSQAIESQKSGRHGRGRSGPPPSIGGDR